MAATNLVFIPWLRRGLAASIVRPDAAPSGTAVPVTTFAVQINATANDPTTVANVNLPLVGPGDIAGLDPRVVVRTEPGKDESDAEFKHFVAIEFDQADLPWRYTPASANSAGQLHPWFTLAVLKDDEWTPVQPSPTQKLPVATIKNAVSLPPLGTAWANAHVQLHGAAINATTTDALNAVLQGQPGQFVARLICPRVLAQQTHYTAMLIPTYMRGVVAGLGTRPDDSVDALQPGWQPTDANFNLPIYYQWQFQTGVVGDFQDLAAALTPEPVPATVGRRDIDVSVPGFDLPNAAVTPSTSPPTPTVTAMPMEGALQSFQASNLGEPVVSTNWLTAIESFINSQQTAVDQQAPRPLVAPPLYGRWHAGQTQLQSSTNQPWLFELNSDPRDRVSAGLGTLVVEERHQELMASAWSQIEGLLKANSERKFLQLGREAFARAFTRHVQSASVDSLHLLFGILQRWVLRAAGDITIHADFGQSVVGHDVFDPQWRRLTRPRGPIGRRQLRHIPGQVTPFTPVTKLGGGFQPAPPPPNAPSGMVSPAVIFSGSVPGNLTPPEVTILVTQGNDVMLFWGILLFCVSRKLLAAGAGRAWWWLLRVMRFGLELIRLAAGTTSTTIRIAVRDGTLTPAQVSGATTTSVFTLQPTFPATIPPPAAPGGADSTDAGEFRSAWAIALGSTATPGLPAIVRTAIDVIATSTRLIAGLSPSVTLIASLFARFKLDLSIIWQQADQLEPVQAAPSFPQPMWAPLRDESVDWILPGLEQVATNSVGLVVSNQRFIEAYMAGLNHEMARTLLWNDFPTDQRGTYFQQFWDSRGNTTGSSLDINPITAWNAAKGLGNNSARSTPASLVLLVRGDIIRRYPNTVVYAIATPTTEPPPSTATQVLPIFSGLLTRDVAYYGFPLSKNDVLTGNGYVFILQEQPAEPRFADPDQTKQGNPTTEPTFILPSDSAINATTAAGFASVTFQHPVRVIIPGNLLVPAN